MNVEKIITTTYKIEYGSIFLTLDSVDTVRVRLCPECFSDFEKMFLTWVNEPSKE